jgi:hypothetical protein
MCAVGQFLQSPQRIGSARDDPGVELPDLSVRPTLLARTIADLARSLPFEQAVVLADSAMFYKRPDRIERANLAELSSGRHAGRAVPPPGGPSRSRTD